MASKNNLLNAFIMMKGNRKLLEKFLADLLTPAEYREINKRIDIVTLINQGVPHKIIAKKLGVGVATVTRGSKALSKSKGGFAQLFNK